MPLKREGGSPPSSSLTIEEMSARRYKATMQMLKKILTPWTCICGCGLIIPVENIIGALAKGRGPLYYSPSCNKRVLRKVSK